MSSPLATLVLPGEQAHEERLHKAINRRYAPDATNQAIAAGEAYLWLIINPLARTGTVALRGIAANAKAKYHPKTKCYYATLAGCDQDDYGEMTYNMRILPHTKGHHNIGQAHYQRATSSAAS